MSKLVDFKRKRSKKELTDIKLSESFLMDEEIFVQAFTELNDYVDSLNIEKHN